eukprot:COSAG02_NODE_1993_length_10163_cov_11.874006_7_plen_106_part_00
MTVLEAARAAANASDGALEVSYSPGVKVQSVDTSGIQHAADTAKDADVALIVVGDSAEAVGYDGSVSLLHASISILVVLNFVNIIAVLDANSAATAALCLCDMEH